MKTFSSKLLEEKLQEAINSLNFSQEEISYCFLSADSIVENDKECIPCDSFLHKEPEPEISFTPIERNHHIIMKVCAVNAEGFERNLNELMTRYGFQAGHYSEPTVSPLGEKIITIEFEPTEQPNVSEQVMKLGRMFHITETSNVGSILLNGLIPRHSKGKFFYNERIYVAKGNATKEELTQLLDNLRTNHSSHLFKSGKKEFTILTIDTSKIPSDQQFFNDPNEPIGIYTPSPIPPDAIISVEQI